ncbi:MAG: hypothetical protein U0232_25040 [Thermomicrobiales bacterium]
MKIFAGLSRTDYEDVFRAVGALIDERGWSNVSLMEVDEGLVVQVMVKADQRETKPRLETYLLTDTDLERVLREAVMRRRKKELEREQEPALTASPKPPPPPSRLIEGLLAAKGGPGNGGAMPRPEPSAPPPAPPVARSLNGSGASSRGASADFSEISSQIARMGQAPLGHTPQLPVAQARPERLPGMLPTAAEDDVAPFDASPFDPAPMRLSNQPPEAKIDHGAARAAVVMAHIVAARLKSGVPMTPDDPDLASLLEQVRALDESNIGEKS